MRALHLNFCPESNQLSYYIREGKLYSKAEHQYKIVKGSATDGTPTWKCIYCKQEVKAN